MLAVGCDRWFGVVPFLDAAGFGTCLLVALGFWELSGCVLDVLGRVVWFVFDFVGCCFWVVLTGFGLGLTTGL